MNKEKYNNIANHIFKAEAVRAAVYDVITQSMTAYRAEIVHGVTPNTLNRYVKKFNFELVYLKSMGLKKL
ncbi:hypothetical protein [Photobacterium andalusiense]|uniref:Uncharacterized protein n=1 Tax=Photobacterium andalusiense TaxID=2204296 RepID=A0A1Y6ME68_9GAMM|nr:hypothetical protein [Photobacterium andalusiense]SMY34855.1 hypothetical protein PAND9192_01535 [Photobacterium andalusiense]